MAISQPILDLLLIDTHSAKSIGISDFSQYPTGYSLISPTLEITASGFSPVTISFAVNSINIFTSLNLNITCAGQELEDLPDGIYTVKYSIAPAYLHNVTRTFLRVEKIQEKFDTAFMKLDILQCDGPLRKQKEEELNSIYYFINTFNYIRPIRSIHVFNKFSFFIFSKICFNYIIIKMRFFYYFR